MHREFYRFGGMTLALESPEELTDSALCRPFRTAEGTAEHTIGLTFSDRLPQPPEDAAHWGVTTGDTRRPDATRCSATAQRGWLRQFTYAVTRGSRTEVTFARRYQESLSTQTVLEAASLFDILADAGMLVLHSSYIVTRQEQGILFSGPSGIGKSTQAALWQRYAGAEIVNGDRALVRPDTGTVSGVFYAGTSGHQPERHGFAVGGGPAGAGKRKSGYCVATAGGLCPAAESVRLLSAGTPLLRRG